MKKLSLSLGLAICAVVSMAAQNFLNPASRMFPDNTILSNWPGNVIMMYNQDIINTSKPTQVTVNAPGVINRTLEATIVPVDITDTGENMGYPFPTLEFNLRTLVDSINFNYGEFIVDIPEGIVQAADGSGKINPKQTVTLYWYKNNEDFTTTPEFGQFNTSALSYTPETLREVRITWRGIASVARNSSVRGAVVALNGNDANAINIDNKVSVDGNALVLDLSGLAEGLYRLFLPVGYVDLYTAGGVKEVNAEISASGNWFSVFDGLNSGVPLPPFAMQGETIPTVDSSQKFVDIKYADQSLSLTGNGTVSIYPNEFKEGRGISIPRANLSIVSDNGTNNVLRINYADVTLDGSFFQPLRVISIPQGLVKNAAGKVNPAQSVIFNVEIIAEGGPQWSPAPGNVIDPGKDRILLTFDGASYISYDEDTPAFLVDEAGTRIRLREYSQFNENGQIQSIASNPAYPYNKDFIEFNFGTMNLSDGKYTIDMPAGAFIISDADFVQSQSPAMDYVFYVGENSKPDPDPEPEVPENPDPDEPLVLLGQPSVNPANRSNLPAVAFTNLYWSSNTVWDIPVGRQETFTLPAESHSKVHITVNGKPIEDGVANIKACNTLTSNEGSGDTPEEFNGPAQLQINFVMDAFFWVGEINISVDEGIIFTVDGKTNPQVNISYNVTRLYDQIPTSVPASVDLEKPDDYVPLGELDKVSVMWGDLKVVSIRNNSRCTLYLPTYLDENDDIVEPRTNVTGTLGADGTLDFNLGSFTEEDGTYVLEIPESTVTLDNGMNNAPVQLTYVVAHETNSIHRLVNTQDGWYDVYTIGGTLLLHTGNAADLDTLAPGIYIINGIKVLITR